MAHKYHFKSWLTKRLDEIADFGLEPTKILKNIPDDNEPVMPVDIEYVSRLLKRYNFGVKTPNHNGYFGEIQWGEGVGAMKVIFTPYRGFHAIIRKLVPNLIGEGTWICKKVFMIGNAYDHAPDSLAQDLADLLKETDQNGMESPTNTYENLENLVFRIANKLKTETTQKIFIYQGIRLIKEDEKYIIHFGVTGMGVQAPDQRRLDQFQIHITYKKNEGIIHITGDELGDSIAKHSWQYSPSQFEENFVPTQSTEEITNAILVLLNSY